ncbi:MAG TPA: M13 family metallopeptidase [Terriglobales bacterium]|nr:M13 family metallopeptidase [Terriglobales bacterium]
MHRFYSLSCIVLSWAILSAVVFAQSSAPQTSPELPKIDHFDPQMADSSLDPCADFYQYACSKWMKANPIPADQVSWSTASPLQLWNETVLRETLEKNSSDDPKRSPVEQKIGDYWYACMDEKGIEATGVKAIQPELDRIAALKNKSQLAEAIAHLHMTIPGAEFPDDNQTSAAVLGFSGQPDYDDATRSVATFDQGGMGLPSRQFYLEDDAKSQDIRKKYLKHVSNMLVLAGEKPEQASKDAATVLDMETAMAKSAMDAVKRRDPKNVDNKMPLKQVEALAPSFDWKKYLAAVGAPSSQQYIVTSPEFFRGLEKLIQQRPLEDWKTYLRWQMLHGSARFLNKAFVDENFDFFAKTLYGAQEQQPRWRRCVRAADRDLGEALGQAYVDRAFGAESKQRVLQLVNDIKAALRQDLLAQDWMTAATKQQAVNKLQAQLEKIGYPDHWRDYSSVQIGRTSYLHNVQQASDFEFRRWVNKIGKPVDRTEWGMTPPTINAYEDPQTNTINFPAGILQPPFFDKDQDDAVNYGAIGTIIGHESIHGFDDQGRKFDAQGNLHDWWTAQDAKEYEARGKCIADEYTQMVPEAGVKQNGLMTQGEDTADNGGIHLAFMALQSALAREGKDVDAKTSNGLTPRQEFFLADANSWCANERPELIRTQVLTNPHSIAKYRINNVVGNMPEFQKAFGCKKGQPMVHENACRVW